MNQKIWKFFRTYKKMQICAILLLAALFFCVANEGARYRVKGILPVQGTAATEKTAYLTFDDGPSAVTEDVLRVLKENDIQATFFLIGVQITEDKEALLKKMVKEGHLLGVHTYCHKADKIYCSAQSYIEDAKETAERIREVTGIKPRYYRFPWGSVNQYLKNIKPDVTAAMEKKGYIYFDWNVSAEDSVGKPTKESILKNIKKDYLKYKEPVILMHDSGINQVTADTLSEIIAMLKKDGYGFATIDKRSVPCQY